MKAFLMVDIQNDFLPGGALAVPEGDQIIPILNTLQGHFDFVLASKDWHPKDHISFTQWPIHCVQETHGADFPPILQTSKIAQVFFKGVNKETECYSAFGNDQKLNNYLQAHGVKELYIAGLTTDYCVKFTALEAIAKGYKTYVIIDACRGINQEDVESAIKAMESAGALMIMSWEI